MGANSRRRHLERIMRRSIPESQFVRPPTPPSMVPKPRIKRSFKVVAIFGWAVLGGAWLVWWAVSR